MKEQEIQFAKLGIKKLLDKSTPIQLLDSAVDVSADEKAVEQAHNQWYGSDEEDESSSKTLRYVFADKYYFNYQGTGFWLYVNGHIELTPGVEKYEVEASEPEIKVIEVEIDEKEIVTISEKEMDDEIKKLINKYSYSRNILVMEQKKQPVDSYQQGGTIESTPDFSEFNKETVEEALRYISENKSDEFMAAYLSEKLDTAHLYGFNEGKTHNK